MLVMIGFYDFFFLWLFVFGGFFWIGLVLVGVVLCGEFVCVVFKLFCIVGYVVVGLVVGVFGCLFIDVDMFDQIYILIEMVLVLVLFELGYWLLFEWLCVNCWFLFISGFESLLIWGFVIWVLQLFGVVVLVVVVVGVIVVVMFFMVLL